MTRSLESQSRRRRFPLATLIAAFTIYNAIIPRILASLDSSIVESGVGGLLSGVIAGEFGLLIIWAVVGPGKAGSRQASAMSLMILLWLALLGGSALVGRNSAIEIGWVVFFLPFAFSIAQLPLWIARVTAGGQIVVLNDDAGRSEKDDRQFGLQQIMGGIFLVALALGLAQSGLQLAGVGYMDGWVPLLSASLTCALYCPFVTRPCIWAALSAKEKGTAALAVGAYTLPMTVLVLIVVSSLVGIMTVDEFVLIFTFHVSLMSVILGTLHVARVCGYRFIGRRGPQEDVAAEDAGGAAPSESEAAEQR